VSACSGLVPVQIELWRDVHWKFVRIGPDANGKVYNERVPNLTAGQLRTVSLSYDINAHQFTGAGLAGSAGRAASVAPAGADAPGVTFMVTDDHAKPPSGGGTTLKDKMDRPTPPPPPPPPGVSTTPHRFEHPLH